MEKNKCPICGSEKEFCLCRKKGHWYGEDVWECAVDGCWSKNQHRLMCLIFNRMKDEIIMDKVLHISPLKCLERIWSEKTHYYLTMDFPPRNGEGAVAQAQMNVDLTHTPFVDNLFTFICCSHVFDQIEDTEQAIREIYRIMKPNGIGFFVVPWYGDDKTEKLDIRQNNKLWRSGLDWFDKYRKVGFDVKLYKGGDEKNVELYATNGEILAVCRKKI